MNDSPTPLCVRFEGTLSAVRVDDELRLARARQAPLALTAALGWGAVTATAGAGEQACGIDPLTLPLRRELIEWLRQQRNQGRRLVLLLDGDPTFAARASAPLELFDELLPTSGLTGTRAERARAALIARFGEHGYDYLGSHVADQPIWQSSRRALVLGDASLARGLDHAWELLALPRPRASLSSWIFALRLHQWAKNLLIFAPAMLAHRIADPAVLQHALLAFVAFGLCASSVYLVNDLLDLNADRQHASKRLRPFAAGTLSARSGLRVALLLIVCAALIAARVGPRFGAALAAYYVLTWAYSLYLKRIPLLDVMLLGALYTLRLIVGAAATGIPLSFWLLAFSVFMFVSLGFVKRYAELKDARRAGKLGAQGRGYHDADLPLIMSLGTASGYSAIVVMALYINSADSQSLYQHHKPLWLICPLMLFWVSRVWLVTARGAMLDDPVVFALRDRVSLLILAALGLIVLLSI